MNRTLSWCTLGACLSLGSLVTSGCIFDKDSAASVSGAGGSNSGSGGSDETGGSGGSDASGGSGPCTQGSELCACYPNGTCDEMLSCLSNICVDGNTTGTGGDGAGMGGSGTGTGGNADGGTGPGPGGTTGSGAMGGTSPTGGAGGTGGGDEVTDPTIIDNFGSCDTDIARVAGRDGYWYFYADNGVNLSSGVGSPPSGFNDQSCGAWATGGCMTTVDFCTFGGLGFSPLSSESPYSFGGTMGLTFDYEGDQVWIQVYTSGANVFGGTVEASPGGRNPRSFSWGSLSQVQGTAGFLDPSQVVKIEFSAADATAGWGMAVWNVRVF